MTTLIGAAALLFFINLWAAAGFWAGVPLSFEAAALLGAGSAAVLTSWTLKQGAGQKAGGAAVRLSSFLLLSLPLYLWIRTQVGHDWLCHIPLAGSIVRGNLPARDLASPGNLLPYHYGFDLLAAAAARLARVLFPFLEIETALDLASWGALALLLTAGFSWLRAVNERMPESARIGWGETVLALVLALYGGGLIFAGKHVDPGVEAWCLDRYAACPPLALLVGRRPTPLGQALFLFNMALLLHLERAEKRRPMTGVMVGVASAALLLTAEELYAAGVLAGVALLFWPATRRAARFFLLASLAALPVALAQGGLLTAVAFNETPAGGGFAWRFRPPFMPGWGLDEPTAASPRFWAAWLVEFPVSLWLVPAALWVARRRGVGLPIHWKVLAACAGLYLLLPLVVQSPQAPQEMHRLFLLPQMLSLLLLPLNLRLLWPAARFRPVLLAGLSVLLLAGPLRGMVAESRHFERLYGRNWRPDLALPLPSDRFERGAVWLVSTRYLPALHGNGIFALSAPFGTYGPNYFKIFPAQHEEWLARYLQDPVRFGATRALLTPADAARLRASGAPFRAEDVTDAAGEPATLFFFSNGSGP